MTPTETNQNPEPAAPAFDTRAYRAGLIFGAVTLIMALGVIKDVWALLKPSGQGQLLFGWLMIRYSSLQRVWFGYNFSGVSAWYATIPHVILYAVGIYGLVTRRRWGWVLISVYLLYIPLSEALYALIASFGYFGRPVIPAEILWAHLPYFVILASLVGLVEWGLWRCRDIFVR